ncbi:MAG: acyl carrier protein [Deltaproteobacteria bacterium]|nr:MAG: acyl carrier protein [Deltaproteobacteria bacterium]
MSSDGIRKVIRHYIQDRFMIRKSLNTLRDADPLLEKGILDSTGVLELVGFIEENFAFSVEDEELLPDNLGSVDNIVRYVERKVGRGVPG